MEPVTSTTRQLGFMRSHGIATADLKGDFADEHQRHVQLLIPDLKVRQQRFLVSVASLWDVAIPRI